jgi:multidrug transporter EmrE-like cation transporter
LAIHAKPGEENPMGAVRIVGIILIVVGIAGFFTGGFSFTKDSTAAKIGPIELTVKEKQTVNFPQWLSIAAVVAGVAALALGGRKS